MTPKKTLAGFGATAMLMAGVDASNLNETPLERVETIANERVEAKQIGNSVETTLPWKGEQGIKVKVDLGEPTLAEKFKDKRSKEVITETVDFGDGGFKVDILLNEKPKTNIFCYQIEGAENYDFFYQPPLTPEEIANGDERPDYIIGSYAVYHKTLKNHLSGAENYATGKVMHIPRPQVWELNNEQATKEWAELSYHRVKDGLPEWVINSLIYPQTLSSDTGFLCVTARQEFLDNATYPVRIDPTFGYTSNGASWVDATDDFYGTRYTAPTDYATIVTGHINCSRGSGGPTAKMVVVVQSTLNITTNGTSGDSGACPINGSSGFRTVTFASEPTITAGTDYVLGGLTNGGGAGDSIWYDTAGTTNYGYVDLTNSYTTPTNPTDATTNDNRYAIYVTYTASSDPSPADNFWDDM